MCNISNCVCREREEREMAEREGREILEEDCDEEIIQSPFQPISNVISVVCGTVAFSLKSTSLAELTKNGLYSGFIFSMRTKKRWIWPRAQPRNFHTKRGEAMSRASLRVYVSTWASAAKRVFCFKTKTKMYLQRSLPWGWKRFIVCLDNRRSLKWQSVKTSVSQKITMMKTYKAPFSQSPMRPLW